MVYILEGFIVTVLLVAFLGVIWASLAIYHDDWEPPIPHAKLVCVLLTFAFAGLAWALSAEDNADHCGPGTEYRESTQYNPATKSTTSTWWCEAK